MLFFTIILIEILAGAEVDLFTPSFPQLQEVFHLNPFEVELTLSVNLAMYCVMSIIVGNMGDRYGRRPLILGGLMVFIVGSFLCMVASHFSLLLLGRGLQGIGMAGPATLAYIVISDNFSLEEQQKKMGVMSGVITLSMALAPLMGSYLTLYFDWQGNFAFLLGLGFIVFIMASVYVPIRQPDYSVNISLRQYLPILKSKSALLHMGSILFICLGYWVFIGISPILYMEDLGISLKHFGYYQGALAACFAFVSFSSPFWLKNFGQKKCIIISLGLLALFSLACLFLIFLNIKDPLAITCVMMLMSVGIVLPVNILWPLCLEVLPEAKGRMAGFFGGTRLILTAFILQTITFFYTHDVRSTAVALVVMMVMGFACLYKLHKINPLFQES